jgi:uncharacterized protein
VIMFRLAVQTGVEDRYSMNTTTTSTSPSETRMGRHPLIWYFALAYAFSWPFWLLSHLAGGTLGTVFIVIGAFGPMLAAAIIISRTGGSVSEWLRSILRWRVSPAYYAYALGLPVLLAAILNLTLAALGKQPDVSLVVERIPAYLQTLLLTAVIFGGQEEPGWRGFALPRLQQRHPPLIATLILGLGWGIWHVPLYGPAGFVVPLVLAFYYTWLYNRTGSVLLCILLHASFTPAQDHLLLTADSPLVDAVVLSTYLLGVGVLIALTRGRLGYEVSTSHGGSDQP